MARYNIYKLHKERENELIEKLRNIGLSRLGTRMVDDFQLTFYMSVEPINISIWWVGLYRDFLADVDEPFNKSYFGVLLISSEEFLYGISLGKSHFYLKEFCDADFGINLAERIVDPNNLRIKNSKLFGGNRNKSIFTYQTGSEIEYDSGESMQFLKAKSINNALWGETVSFGQSVQFNLHDFPPHNLPQLIVQIENQLQQAVVVSLPRVELINDEESIRQLDQRLVAALDNVGDNANLDINETDLSGVDFIFLDKNEFTYLWNRRRQVVHGDITLTSFREFVDNNNINLSAEINSIKVKVSDEYNQGFTKELKYFLDYVDHENYCLLDGKWHKFNQRYIEFIKQEVDKIEIEVGGINFSKSDFELFKQQLPEEERGKIMEKNILTSGWRHTAILT